MPQDLMWRRILKIFWFLSELNEALLNDVTRRGQTSFAFNDAITLISVAESNKLCVFKALFTST